MHRVQEKREYTVLLEGLHRCAKEYRRDGWIVFLWTSLDMCSLCSLLASLCVCHMNKYQFGKRAATKTLRYLRGFFLIHYCPMCIPKYHIPQASFSGLPRELRLPGCSWESVLNTTAPYVLASRSWAASSPETSLLLRHPRVHRASLRVTWVPNAVVYGTVTLYGSR